MELYNDKFLQIDNLIRATAFVSLAVLTFSLTFLVIPFAQWKMHFFQFGVFTAAFLFGPIAGATIGALSSAYNGLFVINNPWIIGGNAILGFFAAYLYIKTSPFKAAMGAFAIQLPYLLFTDIYLAGMPGAIVLGIAATLLAENIICAFTAHITTPYFRSALSRS